MRDRTMLLTATFAALMCGMTPPVGRWVILVASLCAFGAGVWRAYRAPLLRHAAASVLGALIGLTALLLTDRFDVRYVWLYSSAELPLQLKLGNLWGGDEGTTLLLAVFCLCLAARNRAVVLRFDVTALIGGGIALTASWLDPFAATPVEWLARASSQGMNAHLMKIWMLVHAPLVLAAYAWMLALASPAFAALGGHLDRWPADARADARRAWALLTAGIGFGMVWAFEDAMYGQVWHWDPVQTAVFAVWCMLTVHLHGVSGWRPGRPAWRFVPMSVLLAASLTLVAMGITRNESLASSHRYVGATASAGYFALAGILTVAGGAMWWIGSRHVQLLPTQHSHTTWGLRLTQYAFFALGMLAAGHIAWAFIASSQGLPRPDELKPFFATLTNWARSSELPALRMAFAQWDVDGHALGRACLYPVIVVGLIGGWFFLRRLSGRLGWGSLLLAVLACGCMWIAGGPLTREYPGTGVLSQRIVAVLPRLDAALVAGLYMAIGSVAWSIHSARKASSRSYVLSLGLVHVGVMLALWGALLSTALNSYSQDVIELSGEWQREHHGYAFRVTSLEIDHAADGGWTGGNESFRALARVELQTPSHSVLTGQTLYRDARSAVANYSGPVRQICEILDYRYARYANHPGYALHPFIERGWASDVQLWVSTAAAVAALEGGPQPSQAVVVMRLFPFLSLLWVGLTLTTVGALWQALRPGSLRLKAKT